MFSDSEKGEVFTPPNQFFQDGVARTIVILDKKIEKRVGKESGKEYTAVDWMIADAKTGETKDLRYDFAFTSAMGEHKDVMRFETSLFKVLPTKCGEYNGFPKFDYDVQYVGEEGSVAPQGEKEIDVASIPF